MFKQEPRSDWKCHQQQLGDFQSLNIIRYPDTVAKCAHSLSYLEVIWH